MHDYFCISADSSFLSQPSAAQNIMPEIGLIQSAVQESFDKMIHAWNIHSAGVALEALSADEMNLTHHRKSKANPDMPWRKSKSERRRRIVSWAHSAS